MTGFDRLQAAIARFVAIGRARALTVEESAELDRVHARLAVYRSRTKRQIAATRAKLARLETRAAAL